MSNKYFSKNKIFYARACAEKTISPPSDLSIASGDWVDGQLFDIMQGDINPNSNVIVKSVGLFSNFADGLVFKNPSEKIDLQITARAYADGESDAGDTAIVQGNKNITSSTTPFALSNVGDIFRCGKSFFKIETINAADDVDVSNYPMGSQADATLVHVPANSTDKDYTRVISIPVLNSMVSVDDFVLPISLAGSLEPDHLLFFANVNNNNFFTGEDIDDLAHDVDFMTKSVNPAFADDIVSFDVAMELEYTPLVQ